MAEVVKTVVFRKDCIAVWVAVPHYQQHWRLKEKTATVHLPHAAHDTDPVSKLISHYSGWCRLKRAVASAQQEKENTFTNRSQLSKADCKPEETWRQINNERESSNCGRLDRSRGQELDRSLTGNHQVQLRPTVSTNSSCCREAETWRRVVIWQNLIQGFEMG